MKPIKFISLNLWLGGLLFENIETFLKEEKPDILALQEVYEPKEPTENLEKRHRSFSVLQELTGLQYGVFAPAYYETINGKEINSGNAVLSRFPIKEHRAVFYDTEYRKESSDITDYSFRPRNLEHAKLDIEGRDLDIFNTQGIWGFDGKDSDRRLKMARTIVENIKNHEHALLCGDFNVDMRSKSMEMVREHMEDIFWGKLKTTFNMRQKKEAKFGEAVIDTIFASKGINVQSAYVSEADASDHIPFILNFSL